MLFDDRLATVLRTATRSEAAARTQYRQLLDLLGSMPEDAQGGLLEAAYRRLGELADELPATVQSQILRAPGLRLRNRALVTWMAQREPQAAAAAMATARLTERDWLYLIPRLPLTARGFLRHRRDLPLSTRHVLERLGVRDLVLPEPAVVPGVVRPEPAPAVIAPAPSTARDQPAEAEPGIGALVQRIEAFQRARRQVARNTVPQEAATTPTATPNRFDFTTDAAGVITWAEPPLAPLAVGMTLGASHLGGVAQLDEGAASALGRRLPLSGRVLLAGPSAIAGPWQIDAAPAFDPTSGSFAGYRGRMRRLSTGRAESPDTANERMRQVLHELRTPVNAIQGFAEIIQQQLFGPAPHEYRALAGAVAVDAARLMAGFDELDRLARLESGALELAEGSSDLRMTVLELLRRLDGVLRPRSARIELDLSGSSFIVPIEGSEALQLAWRLLATLAGAMAPGEIIDLALSSDGRRARLRAELPAALREEADVFAASAPAQPRAVSAGMFGCGFAFRLARAEAIAAGGTLVRQGEVLTLELPTLTGPTASHTEAAAQEG